MLLDGALLVNGSSLKLGVVNASEKGTALPASATEGDNFELTAVYAGKQPGLYWWHNGEWVVRSPDLSAVPYDLSGGSTTTLAASAIVMRHVAVRAFGISATFIGSIAVAGQAPSANIVIEVRRIDRTGFDSAIGEIQFAVGSTTGVFVQNGTGNMNFAQGEIFYVKGPDVADLTLSELSITIAGFLI